MQIPQRVFMFLVAVVLFGSTAISAADKPNIIVVTGDDIGWSHFGKNHLGDKNHHLPCEHGFDEYFGWLYHLDAMQDPFNPTCPPELKATIGPRNLVHCVATNKDDTTVPRYLLGRMGV